MLPFHNEPVIHENIIAKILFAFCSAKLSYCKNFRVYGIKVDVDVDAPAELVITEDTETTWTTCKLACNKLIRACSFHCYLISVCMYISLIALCLLITCVMQIPVTILH